MGVFFALLLIPMAIQHIAIKGHYIQYEKRNKSALFFFFFLLTLLVMFRHESIGNDTRNYIFFFKKFGRIEWQQFNKTELESGFVLLNKLIYLISHDSRFYIVITAVVVSMMIYPTYSRLCVDAALTIVLFCFMSTFAMMFSGIRQMLAIGIGFIAYDFTRNKRLFPFLLTVAFAVTFHTSAFMLVFMYPLYHAKITKRWLFIVIPIMALVFLFNKPIFSSLAMILKQYTSYETEITSTGAYTTLILFVLFTTFSFIISDEKLMDTEVIGLRNFMVLALLLQMFAPVHVLAMRMNYYYIIFIPLLLPKIIQFRSKRWNQVAIMGRNIMVVFFFVYFFINASLGGSLNVFPYHFFWENVR